MFLFIEYLRELSELVQFFLLIRLLEKFQLRLISISDLLRVSLRFGQIDRLWFNRLVDRVKSGSLIETFLVIKLPLSHLYLTLSISFHLHAASSRALNSLNSGMDGFRDMHWKLCNLHLIQILIVSLLYCISLSCLVDLLLQKCNCLLSTSRVCICLGSNCDKVI